MAKVYYWNKQPNFGDGLAPLLLKKFTGLTFDWANPVDAEIVVVGSILDQLPEDWQGVIAGAGKLHEGTKLKFPNAKILGFRGPLTAKGFRGNFVLADPALLADELVPQPEKEYNLGIVAHWTDISLEHNPIFKKYNPKIINVRDHPLKVITEIGQCKKIVSSSLHGIIIADAFGIPRRIEIAPKMLSRPEQEGGLFKWEYYSASLGMDLEIGKTVEADRNRVVEKQHEIYDLFKSIESRFSQA